MTATEKDRILLDRIRRVCQAITLDDVHALRRAELVLHRWGEQECGDSNEHCSWAIERDESTGLPYRAVYPHNGKPRKVRIPDRESGALRRIAEVCNRHGLFWFHQGDPRGCALFVSNEPLTDANYSNGVAVCT